MANVLFVTLEAQAFLNQRLALANGLRAAGHSVMVASVDGPCRDQIKALDFDFHPIPLNRKGKNPVRELSFVAALNQLFRELRPDAVLGFALKPALYSALATLTLPTAIRPRVIGTITGLGFVYTENTMPVLAVRAVVNGLFAVLGRVTPTVFAFQNDDDMAYFQRILPARSRIRVPGSGIDTELFSPGERQNNGRPTVLFPARMLRHKGVIELIGAIPQVLERHPDVKFVFLGSPDPANPASIPESEFNRLVAGGAVEWVPTVPRSKTVDFYRAATIVCLPSYREGLPMALMEAAACGAPLVATDVPGCREVCLDGETGRLVAPQNSKELAEGLNWILDRPDEAVRLGANARDLIVRNFSVDQVARRYLELIQQCGSSQPRTSRLNA